MPGKEHGVIGRGTNVFWRTTEGGGAVDILRHWVEKGEAPDMLYAVGFNGRKAENGIKFKREVYPVDNPDSSFSTKELNQIPLCDDEYLNL